MLDAMRQNSRSAIIYILFGVLIAAFVISFGPGGLGLGGNSNPVGTGYAARVLGNKLEANEYQLAQTIFGQYATPKILMDQLISRELLAEEAERMGLAVSEDEASEQVTNGRILVLGLEAPIDRYAFKDGRFDYERFRAVVQNYYHMSVKKLMEVQRREMLADKVRQLLRVGTKASFDEVKADFEEKNRQVNLTYVRFASTGYDEGLAGTEAEIEAWAKANEAAVKKLYDERKEFLYTKQDKTAHLRRILVELPKDADAATKKAAEAKMAAAQATLKSGTPFAQVARTVSEDANTKGKGGDLGWRRKGATFLPDDAEAKVFAAKDAELPLLIGPVQTDKGLELIRVEGFREGDVPFEKARAELAEELWRSGKAKELAKKAADEAAAKVKGGAKLAELFPKAQSDAEEAQAKGGKGGRVEAEDTGLFSRRGDVVQGVGASAELAKLVFGGKTKDGEVLGPIEVSGSYVVAVVKERKEPDMADFDKRKEELAHEFQQRKAAQVMQAWTLNRCTEANAAGKIQVNTEVMVRETRDGTPQQPPKYEPCQAPKL